MLSLTRYNSRLPTKAQKYVNVLLLALLTALGSLILGHLLKALHLDGLVAETSRTKEKYNAQSIIFLLLGALTLAPLIEETLTRGLPILIMKKLRWDRFYWVFAVCSSLLFSELHTYGSHFPLVQFLFGLIAFFIAYTYGLRYSILLHAANNGFVLLLGLLWWLLTGK